MSKNTIIDGIAASEHIDSSGESLSIEGMDISSLGGPDSILNWEHGSKDRPGQVVGKVTFARKIMKKEDAKSQREQYFWNKAKKPFVYIKAELFDGLGHSGAEDVAAMLKYKNKDKGEDSRLVVGFSIEGGKIEKKGMFVTKSIARDVAITIKPCNKICDAEVIEGEVADDFLYKNQNFDCEIIEGELSINSTSYRSLLLESIKKSEWKPSKEEKEQIKELKITPKVNELIEQYDTDNNMRKALIAGMFGGSPDSKTGMAALAPEHLEGKLEKPFRSKAQRKFAYANPEKFGGKEGIEEWESKTSKKLPEKVKKSEQSRTPIFTTKTTGMPGYDDMLKNPEYFKNKKGVHFEIKDMSPEEYLNIAADGYYKQTKGTKHEFPSVEHARESLINERRNSKNMDKIKSYDVLHMPTLDFKNQWTTPSGEKAVNQEGLHRTIHAMDSGLKSVPVLVIKDANEVKKAEELKKMSRPMMQNPDLGLGQDVRMDVKTVNPKKEYTLPAKMTSEGLKPEKKYSAVDIENKKLTQMAQQGMIQQQKNPKNISSKKEGEIKQEAAQIYGDILTPQEEAAANVNIPKAGQRSFEYTKEKPPGQGKTWYSKKKWKEVKSGRPEEQQLGHKIHEATHGFFTDVINKYGRPQAIALSDRLLKENFHPKDRQRIKDWIKNKGYKVKNERFNEEHITHVSDILNNPSDKKSFYEHLGFKNPQKIFKQIPSYVKALKTGEGMEQFSPEELNKIRQVRQIDRRLKRGWENATKFTNNPLQMADFLNQFDKKKKG